MIYVLVYIYNWYNFYDVFFDNKNMLIVKYIYMLYLMFRIFNVIFIIIYLFYGSSNI